MDHEGQLIHNQPKKYTEDDLTTKVLELINDENEFTNIKYSF